MCILTFATQAIGQASANQSALDSSCKISLPNHLGQLQWQADGWEIIESSAKSKGQEIGLRGQDASKRVAFLGFLFLIPEEAPLSSAKCSDGALVAEKKNPTPEVLVTSQREGSKDPPVALVTNSTKSRDGKKWYTVRGFVATGDICGDLEFYSETSISADDPDLRKILESYGLDPSYAPQFRDIFRYVQILYKHQMSKAAAPVFEQALAKLGDDNAKLKMRRVTTHQAGRS